MADEKLTAWARVRKWRRRTRRRIREWWRSDDEPGERERELRGYLKGGYQRRDLVRWVVTDLDLPLELDFTDYLRLNRRLVRHGLRAEHRAVLGSLAGFAAFWVVGYLIARRFHGTGVGDWVMGGFFGMLPVLLVLLALMFLLRRLPRTGLFAALLVHVAVEAAAGLVVYGEIVGAGPVHAIAHRVAEQRQWYFLLHGTLLYASIVTAMILVLPFRAIALRRGLRRDPTANAVNRLFWCVWLAHDEQEFMLLGTRRRLVSLTREVSQILQHGLWRSVWVSSPLASAELRKRCVHAGQSVEMLCAQLVLPGRATREEYLEKTLRLADTLISGRLGELPDDPERAAYSVRSKLALAGRVAVEMTVSVTPLAVFLLLRHFHLIPPSAEVPVLTLCVAWLATYGLNAIGRRHPGSSSQFPNVLGIFGSTK